jgi:transglutaminase-like putative cysteine protease
MYDIRQFKPAMYALLLIGMTGFAIAAQWPGLWLLSVGGILLNAWLVKTGRFMPMPRFLASIVTIIAFLYIADLVVNSQATPILIIGQFLVLLQLVKLYEQRANRDYAQLIILSLLLMVAAAINTASLIFGLLFIAYLFLSLYVCLLFHLKVESEEARKAIALPEVEPNPATLRQDQRFLSSSMRRLTGLIAMVAVVMAVMVFLFFPRGTGANLLGPIQPGRVMTGFSEQVAFQNFAKITQSNDPVADVKIWHNGQQLMGTEAIYLRGLTLNHYTGPGTPAREMWGERRWARPPYQWIRMMPGSVDKEVVRDDDEITLDNELADSKETWRQEIKLKPTGSRVIFAMAGPVRLKSERRLTVSFTTYDDFISGKDDSMSLDYEVVSVGKMPYVPVPPGTAINLPSPRRAGYVPSSDQPDSVIDPQIAQYARRPEVSGRGQGGVPLVQLRDQYIAQVRAHERERAAAEQRIPDESIVPFTPFDDAIAANIQNHLRTTFTYTLDLTDARRIENRDPMVAFLYDLKRGHCEYFAGAMTLMLQSLDIPARMVIGFRCDDFNSVGGYYRVEQNQAHAWVEARGGWTPDAAPQAQHPMWITYDPTSGREDMNQRAVTVWTRMRNVFDYLEHTWASSVIAYDRGSRDNLVRTLEDRLTNVAISGSTRMREWPAMFQNEKWKISAGILALMTLLAIIAAVAAIGWFAWERWRMRRRAARIGIELLPTDERLRLARQLGFYDELLMLLERRGITRPSNLTPMEFTDGLSFLPADAYHTVRRLTEVFYRIRYGRQELHTGQRDKLRGMIQSVEHILGPAPAKPA